ncbi:hypothetical protein FD723_17660 [Nostoc sp. C052]|uniref:hypothetical protein n=1 Tax=Nostoc sp. C052 TaxID=2576902 RepID=UPI0015C2DAAE|nr:hypothetical protein [Nostoc sp. C052]QLE42065.1 hypothetical protein FD723_17660 [Nostoc sp. C052]
MQAKEIKTQLTLLIEEASIIDPGLAKRLEEINRWVKDIKPGSLTAKRFVILFLQQMIQDAEVWLKLKSLPSEEEQQSALRVLNPTLKYWYGYLFPKWLSGNDPKFYIWRRKLMAGEFNQEDAKLIGSIANNIKSCGGTTVLRYVADLSMATDIIVSSTQKSPLCIQLTSVSEEFSQEKFDHWENTLIFWAIDRGLFLSYNPRATDFVNQIVNILLYNSDNLSIGSYLKFNL